jgi:LysM repeat protein
MWTKSACVQLAAWLVLAVIIMTAAATGLARPAPVSARTANTISVTLAAAPAAARTTGPPAGPASRDPAARYVVQPGDSLSAIATTLGVRGGWPALYAANHAIIGPDPDVILPGTVLVLPGPRAPVRYTIAAGDTLSGIAATLDVRGGWRALYAANRAAIGSDPNVIRPGTVLTIAAPPTPGQHPAPPPPPPTSSPRPGHHPAPSRPGHRAHRPAATPARAASGMPPWLKTLLIAVAVIIAVAFLTEPVLIIRRRRRTTTAQPATGDGELATNTPAPATNGARLAPADPSRVAAQQARIVLIDSDRLIVVRSTDDGTIYVLRPPGADPAAILHVARLVLPEFRYGEFATRFGMPPTWPIVMADYDRLVVTCSKHDGTVTVLRPPGEDPRQVLAAARLVLPEGPYGELADHLGMPANWPIED